jgi:hypothetical protein
MAIYDKLMGASGAILSQDASGYAFAPDAVAPSSAEGPYSAGKGTLFSR